MYKKYLFLSAVFAVTFLLFPLFMSSQPVTQPEAGLTGEPARQVAEHPVLDFNIPPLLMPYMETAPELRSRAAVMIDVETGTVIFAENPHMEIPPASLTKLMTMHLVKRAVADGHFSLDDVVPFGEESWAENQPPRSSLMFLGPGQVVTMREIMIGLAVPSGNDAAVAAAVHVSSTVEDFVHEMNLEAQRMGLSSTRFVEPSGVSPYNMTTAADFAAFSREYVRLHPQSLTDFHSIRNFAFPTASHMLPGYHPRVIVQNNNNTLLRLFPGTDGLKTGFIGASGFNIALTAERDHTRFVTVILGAPAVAGGARIREADGNDLFGWAFENFRTVRPFIENIEPVRLWKGSDDNARLVAAGSKSFTSPVSRSNSLWYYVELNGPLVAPVPAGYHAGYLVLIDSIGEVNRVPLVTAEAHDSGSAFRRFWHSIRLAFER
ncbi:MAG: D-alanyl-D-alanine carboxypeptidase [Spirochaetes bacterium]|nr:D-alanyl-D-alanine carboxypeptidase [Spirochaetota bacterium]